MVKKIAVVGVGKLGICFALNFERSGFEVWGIETNADYLNSLKDGTFRSAEPEVNQLLSKAQHLHFTDGLDCISENGIDDIFIMVATPSLADGSYDHSQVDRVADRLIEIANKDNTRHVYVGCTTMPGYCNDLAKRLEPFGYTVSYNPEFIAQGAIIHDQRFPDQILIGEASVEVGDRLQFIYEAMVQNNPTYCRMDPLSAEIAKLATNCFLTTKISFANSIGDMAVTAGADPDKILAAVGADSRIGGKYLKYGFGFGGPCFPRDNRALGKFGEMLSMPLHLSNSTDKINDEHFDFQFNQYLGKYAEGEEVVFDGVAYKKGTTQITESQQLRLAVALAKSGRAVRVVDNKEVLDQLAQLYPGLFELEESVVRSS